MPPAATRRSHGTRRARSNVAPRHPRRVSGPARAATAPAVALPRPGTGVFERLRALPDHRVVDRLLRGRACIWIIGLALGGIVAMQVSLLKLNSGISRAVEASGTLQRQNADLESSIARLASGERIRAKAVMANGGHVPGTQVAPLTAAAGLGAVTPAQAQTSTADPAATGAAAASGV